MPNYPYLVISISDNFPILEIDPSPIPRSMKGPFKTSPRIYHIDILDISMKPLTMLEMLGKCYEVVVPHSKVIIEKQTEMRIRGRLLKNVYRLQHYKEIKISKLQRQKPKIYCNRRSSQNFCGVISLMADFQLQISIMHQILAKTTTIL